MEQRRELADVMIEMAKTQQIHLEQLLQCSMEMLYELHQDKREKFAKRIDSIVGSVSFEARILHGDIEKLQKETETQPRINF